MVSGLVNLNRSGSSTINLSGDFLPSGGTVNLRAGTGGSAHTNLNIHGDFSQTGGVVTRSLSGGAANINFRRAGTTSTFTRTGGSITNPLNYTVADNGKILDLGTKDALIGQGSFTLFNGALLHVKSLDAAGAIQNNTTAGNIRVSGTRTYQAGSTIIYNGSAAQFIGNGHPANPHTIVNNTNGVTLASNVTFNGNLIANGPIVAGYELLLLAEDLSNLFREQAVYRSMIW